MRGADTAFGKKFTQSFGLKISLDGQRGVLDTCANDIVLVTVTRKSGAVLLDTCYIIHSLSMPDQKEFH